MRYESTDWSIEVPDDWSYEFGEDCTTFEHPQGVGAFQVSSYRKDETVTDDDLLDFAGELPLTAVSLGCLTGFITRFNKDETFWTMWWLRAGCQMIYVTYNCLLPDCGREDAEVSRMIESLTPDHTANTD
jgi:hypothetical protein